jgi:hypothetical protein
MSKHILLHSILLICCFTSLKANPITEAEALHLATVFHESRTTSKLRSADVLTLVSKGPVTGLRSASVDPPYYIYNIGDGKGFVVLSGDDATKTVLGYSDEGSFQVDRMPDNLNHWLNFYQQEIEAVRAASAAASTSTGVSTAASGSVAVAPLLGDIKWNQSEPYNLKCPLDAPSGLRTLAGCVAVAMAQIMRYHRWPVTGTGTHSYTDGTYGLQSVDLSKTTYDWNLMLGSYTSSSTETEEAAVSTFIYQCGVTVDMDYSTTGSASTIAKASEALVSHFGYDSEIQRYERPNYTSQEWNNLIKNELNNSRPVYFSANSDAGGHAFVVDGYDSNDLFHINWGWGGMSNGYFELSSLSTNNPGEVGAAPEFCYFQSILANIHRADAVNKSTNQIVVYKNGLTASVKSVAKINTSSFTMSFSFANVGTNNVQSRWGIGYMKTGSTMPTKLVEYSSSTYTSIPATQVYSYTFTISNPTALATAGVYRLYPIYLPKDSVNWSIMRGTTALNNCMIVTVASNNGAATFVPDLTSPSLELTNTSQPQTNLYQNKAVNVDVSFRNNGIEFFSRVGISLVNKSNPNDRSFLCESKVLVPAGDTCTFHLSGTVTSPPGNYYLQVQFDSTNSNSTLNYKTFAPVYLNNQSVTVLPQPGQPQLQLNQVISMAEGTTITRTDTVQLTLDITNKGGFFDSRLVAFVFPKGGGKSLTSLGKYVYLDSLETKNILLNGTIDLEDGDYSIYLYQLLNNAWMSLTPYGMASLNFTVSSLPSVVRPTIRSNDLRIHQEGNRILAETDAEILRWNCYDLTGRLVCQQKRQNYLDKGPLPAGIYLMQLRTTEKNYLERVLIQ